MRVYGVRKQNSSRLLNIPNILQTIRYYNTIKCKKKQVCGEQLLFLRLIELFLGFWYTVLTMSNFPIPNCSRCGSKLIQLKEKVEKSSIQQSPVTTIVYKCSNKECQAEIDRKQKELAQKRAELEALQAANAAAAEEAKIAKAEAAKAS